MAEFSASFVANFVETAEFRLVARSMKSSRERSRQSSR
jgi:hypothetical protein